MYHSLFQLKGVYYSFWTTVWGDYHKLFFWPELEQRFQHQWRKKHSQRNQRPKACCCGWVPCWPGPPVQPMPVTLQIPCKPQPCTDCAGREPTQPRGWETLPQLQGTQRPQEAPACTRSAPPTASRGAVVIESLGLEKSALFLAKGR